MFKVIYNDLSPFLGELSIEWVFIHVGNQLNMGISMGFRLQA